MNIYCYDMLQRSEWEAMIATSKGQFFPDVCMRDVGSHCMTRNTNSTSRLWACLMRKAGQAPTCVEHSGMRDNSQDLHIEKEIDGEMWPECNVHALTHGCSSINGYRAYEYHQSTFTRCHGHLALHILFFHLFYGPDSCQPDPRWLENSLHPLHQLASCFDR